MPALDLDVLLNGLRPVVQGLNPQDVNALTSSLMQIIQGQGGTLDSLLSRTSSFSNALADDGQVLAQLIDNLNAAMGTLAKDGDKFTGAIDRLQRLDQRAGSQERDPIGAAIDSLSQGAGSIASLLAEARPPLAATVNQLNRLAPLLEAPQRRARPWPAEGRGFLPQAGPAGRLRQLHQVLPMRRHPPGQ